MQGLCADMQSWTTEACGRQMKGIAAASERVAGAVPDFLACRQPLDVAAAGSKLLADMLDLASGQARLWAELSQNLRERLAAATDQLAQQGAAMAGPATAGGEERASTTEEKERAAPEPARRKSA
jgi:hypothetical protein